MFHKPVFAKENIIIVNSTMSVIPEDIQESDKKIVEELLTLVKLIAEKYSIEDVKASFNKAMPTNVSIIFADYISIKPTRENEHKRPIDFLKSFDGELTKEDSKYPHLTKSVFTINQAKCSGIIQGLKLVATPSQKETESRYEAREFAKC